MLTFSEFDTLKSKTKELENLRKRLVILQKGQERATKRRHNFKRKLTTVANENNAAKILKLDAKRGCPSLEETQPGLLETIIKLATFWLMTNVGPSLYDP